MFNSSIIIQSARLGDMTLHTHGLTEPLDTISLVAYWLANLIITLMISYYSSIIIIIIIIMT